MVLVVHGARETTVPLAALDTKPLSLDPANLPEYALRTTLRMLAAIVWSLIFTFVYVHLAKGLSTRMMDWLWLALVLAGSAYAAWRIVEYVRATLSFSDVMAAAGVGLVTLLRVIS
jgi:ABC-type anion transport system duplicated permease subunit